jgi:predicted HD phosphohydrolase|tara:strand:- start:51 stop:629 length:579 start_codon:yes stop_codon:yes gene_type:complete
VVKKIKPVVEKVKFKQMKEGSKEDYLLLNKLEKKFIEGTADRVLKTMQGLTSSLVGYQINRLEHSLQTATRALKEKASDEMIVAALLHDIGDELAPNNHAEFAAAILKPYVSEKTAWIVEKHGIFQMYYYAHHLGFNKNERDKYKGHKYYPATAEFCEKWDQISFDPNYKSLLLKEFEPYVKKIFSRTPYSN